MGRPGNRRRSYVAGVIADTRHLATAGLTLAEVERVIRFVQEPIVPLEDPPVLCHGDLSPEHVFVDADLRVVGLIDWGQWYAGSAGTDLAGLAPLYRTADLVDIHAGHGFPTDSVAHDQLLGM